MMDLIRSFWANVKRRREEARARRDGTDPDLLTGLEHIIPYDRYVPPV